MIKGVMAIRLLDRIIKQGHVVLLIFIVFFELFFHSCHGLSSTMQTRLSDNVLFKELLIMPTANIEQHAKELYDKALLDFGPVGKTVKEHCATWIEMGCSCSGTSDELVLQCKGLGIQDIPKNLPKELHKL
jgi:hypothetical protein